MIVGAQLYTLRDFCKTPDDLAETLKKVADIGYTTVQLSGTCPVDPAWFKEQLDANGLRCVITHTPLDRLQNEPETVAKEHDVFDCRYVGLGYFGMNKPEEGQTYARFLEVGKPIAQALKSCDKYFMYHNHAFEFAKQDGKVLLQRMAEDFSVDELGFTLDTFWVQTGGGDPAWWIEYLKGRVPCIHLKDYAFATDRQTAVIGEGNINFDRVFTKAQDAGTEFMLVEQDDCNGEDPFECLRRSYEFLKSCGFR